MTTKPKARKFRIRRAAPLSGAAQATPQQTSAPRPQSGPQNTAGPTGAGAPPSQSPPPPSSPPMFPPNATGQTGRTGQIDSPSIVQAENTIEAIRREGLTGRQLRMARRVAQKHGLAPVSDFDAVRLLRAKNVDPFQRANILELVVPTGKTSAQAGNPLEDLGGVGGQEDQITANLPVKGHMQLPQTMPVEKHQLPAQELSPADRRAKEIKEIQRDIKKRRRKKMGQLLTRLSIFVFLPTIMSAWYFFAMATPMYAVKAEFLILQADNAGGSGLGGLLSGTQFATNQDSIATQSYLQSKDAMIRLDQDAGFIAHFSQDWIDPIQRLDAGASNEDAYKLYQSFVKIGYDPTEGVIRMEVAAAAPETSARFAERLIDYAENRVDALSIRKREDGMVTARESLVTAKQERREAQEALVSLQEGAFVDPQGVIVAMRAQINNVEIQLQEKELQLAALQDNQRPNRAKVEGMQGDVRRLNALLHRLSTKMTDATTGEASLAEKTIQIQMAQADLATADLFLQSALTNEKQTALEANRQVRYLETSVHPVQPEDATYPRSFENTILAFLIFSGIYLMISLTASILREQVSS